MGTHWAVLQTAAWVRMTWGHSQATTLADAVGRVLGGGQPCRICKWVREGRANEPREAVLLVKQIPEFEMPPGMVVVMDVVVLKRELIPDRETAWEPRVQVPPKPRPRMGFSIA